MKLYIKTLLCAVLLGSSLSLVQADPVTLAKETASVAQEIVPGAWENVANGMGCLCNAGANMVTTGVSYLPAVCKEFYESAQGIENFTKHYPGKALILTGISLYVLYKAGLFRWIGDKTMIKVHETRESLERKLAVYRAR